MDRAKYIGTVPLDFLDHSDTNWQVATTDDIFQSNLISFPNDHLFTLGSGVNSHMTSLATTPGYFLPTESQFYLAGRHAFRWGGTKDPYEIDFDHYGFTPDYNKGVAIVWKAPKSERHHLSETRELVKHIPSDWREICLAVIDKKLI